MRWRAGLTICIPPAQADVFDRHAPAIRFSRPMSASYPHRGLLPVQGKFSNIFFAHSAF